MNKVSRFIMATILVGFGIAIIWNPHQAFLKRPDDEFMNRAFGLLCFVGGVLLYFNKGG